jgi:hypothetical protein
VDEKWTMLLILAQIYTHEQRRGTRYRSTFLGYVIIIYYFFDNVEFFKNDLSKTSRVKELTDYLPKNLEFKNTRVSCI